MGVFEFLRTKKGPPQSQASEMQAQLEKLRAEMKQVTAVVESHGQRRADALLSDVTDEAIAKIDADAALAQIRLERLELAELELVECIAGARDASERNRRATELTAAAAAIESKVAALDSAIGALAIAFADLVSVVPTESGVLFDAGHMPRSATAEDVGRAILASGLFTAAPAMFEMVAPRHHSARPACVERILSVLVHRDGTLSPFNPGLIGEEADIPPAAIAAEQFIVSPLRAQARALRDSAPLSAAAE